MAEKLSARWRERADNERGALREGDTEDCTFLGPCPCNGCDWERCCVPAILRQGRKCYLYSTMKLYDSKPARDTQCHRSKLSFQWQSSLGIFYLSFLDHAYKRSPGTVSARNSISVQSVQLGMNQMYRHPRDPKERELLAPLWLSLSAGVSISGGYKIKVL
uniref:Uncharacterized protein n=1 Tax=Geospiza parvula TaxID=87175 RepID=A0A8C3NJT5_GEOPR